jgi:hypothetical protein
MARPNKSPITATISTFLELPGAVFFGDVLADDVDIAVRKQRIRANYESTDDQATLWHELRQMGFGAAEISASIASPAAITNCAYGWPLGYARAA